MKYLNCQWCGSSHGFFYNKCPSCGGTLTHKSDLLNLLLNKLRLTNDRNKIKALIENKHEAEKSSFFSSLRQVIVSVFLITARINLAVIALVIIVFVTKASIANYTSRNTSEYNSLNSQKPQKKLSAEQQLHQLMRDEKIKVGSKTDIENWVAVARKNGEPYTHRMYPGGNTYVVEHQITFPDDMYGSHSRTFILNDKVKLPYGDMAHNTVYFMSDGKCIGTACTK